MTEAVRRSRDSGATRQALIAAARELFEEKGYGGATVRAIGERAGVDPALIARYFDNKEGLYLATLSDESDQATVKYAGLDPEEIVDRLFHRWDERGRTPVARAMASAELDDEVLEQIRALVRLRLRGPLAEGLEKAGAGSRSDLIGEVLIGAVLGICVTRANGALPVLSEAEADEVAALVRKIAGSMIG
ncbi:MAG: TetR/AcrR family transcriptional regulator [Solirubrobacterales bacterium]|nr:TetR/AcrR family transcriptional regulator [Solirubrobacterales bacterium]